MAEQKNQNEHLNVEDALTQSEAFLVKYKNAIIGGVVAVIIIVAGFIMYKNLYASHVKKRHRLLFSKDRNTLNKMLMNSTER